MRPEKDHESEKSENQQSKKPYATPALTIYGLVEKETGQSNKPPSNQDSLGCIPGLNCGGG